VIAVVRRAGGHTRPSLRGRNCVVFATSVILLLAACGGGGSSKPASAPSNNSGDAGATTTTSGGGDGGGGSGSCFTKPGTQTAKVRFVNLFTNTAYPSTDIDVWQGYGGTDPCAKKLATVKYGSASDYIDVTAADSSGNWAAGAYVTGSTADDHKIIDQSETWKGGERVTIVFMGSQSEAGSNNAPSSGADQTFYESHSDINSTLDAVPGKGLIAIGAASIEYVVKDGSWNAGIVGQSKCLTAVGDTDTEKTSIGGTSLIPYPVDPGTVSIGLYLSDPGTCTGTPAIGPATVSADAGSRTLVFAYGVDPQNLELLVLPVAS